MHALEAIYSPPREIQLLSLRIQPRWLIAFSVTLLHLVALCLLTFSPHKHQTKKAPQKLIVHTVSLQSPSRTTIVEPKAAPAPVAQAAEVPIAEPVVEEIKVEEPAPKPEPKRPPKKVEVKKPVVNKVKPKPTPKPTPKPVTKPKPVSKPKPAPKETQKKEQAAKEKAAALEKAAKERAAKEKAAKEKAAREKAQKEKQNALVTAALSSLDSAGKIDNKKGTLAKESGKVGTTGPASISKLASESLVTVVSSDSPCSPHERSYYDELVGRLKLSLKLPEYGQVKLQLTVSRAGKVLSVKGIKSKSKKNSAYIEKTLPKLMLPPFGQNFPGEKDHTFQLTLSNELNY